MNANLLWLLREEIRKEIREVVREELQQAAPEETKQSKRIHELEQCLNSFLDFVLNPKIAGQTWASIHLYEAALCEKARDLLEMDK